MRNLAIRDRASVQAKRSPAHPWPDDAALVQALVQGDPEAIAVVWKRYVPLVFSIVRRVFGPDPEAEDVTQEVLGCLFRRVKTLRDPHALSAFVTSVAVRVVKWELRRRRARRFLTLSSTGQLPELPVAFADSNRHYAIHQIYRVLDRMNARERLVLVLKHAEGMTLEEVADALEISTATVKRILRRASAHFHALAGDHTALSELGWL